MSKKAYILILFILAFGLLSNIFTASFLTRNVSFVLTMLWGIVGWFYFPASPTNSLNNRKHQSVAWVIVCIMLLSMLVPYYHYGQSLVDTFFSQRFNYAILFLPVFLRIIPSDKDFLYSIKICAYVSLAGYIVSLVFPQFFLTPEAIKEMLESRKANASTDIGFAAPGFNSAIIYLYYKTGKLFHRPTMKDIIEASAFMLYIILVQNRSTIIGTLPFYCIGMVMMKTQKKMLFITLAVIALVGILPFLNTIYSSLVNETQLQLEDENYNRWQALSLYLVEMKNDFISVLLGNGVWSKSGYYLEMMLQAQFSRGTYISDIGWLGTYFYYGIVPVSFLLYYSVKAIWNNKVPAYLKYYACWIILIPTIHGFLQLTTGGGVLFAMYFYLIMYYTALREKVNVYDYQRLTDSKN
ncbi:MULTISPECIES: hypothetical protein [unclassified Bacteroides]|jgi:hypothetical protein|uniref:hypothetical protein n=1 Tax=unclassified Bacteroides TaxID=2646097 RepID=UPI000EFF05F8|nr:MULTISPECIES: hypothetical protein [unclassified Bacteroides]